MYYKTKHKARKHFCMHCLQSFTRLQAYSKKQKADCIVIHGNQAIKIPDKNKTLKFNYIQKQLPVPFVIYADLTP